MENNNIVKFNEQIILYVQNTWMRYKIEIILDVYKNHYIFSIVYFFPLSNNVCVFLIRFRIHVFLEMKVSSKENVFATFHTFTQSNTAIPLAKKFLLNKKRKFLDTFFIG